MRPNVTKGERRIGRTIRKIEASVELSSKETYAKQDEKNYKETVKQTFNSFNESPVQSLRFPAERKKDPTTP